MPHTYREGLISIGEASIALTLNGFTYIPDSSSNAVQFFEKETQSGESKVVILGGTTDELIHEKVLVSNYQRRTSADDVIAKLSQQNQQTL